MLLALAAAVAMVPQRSKADDVDKVLVVNGAKKAVPVAGNVGITGLPAVQLAQGTTVVITGTPNANVANSPRPVALRVMAKSLGRRRS
jgi:hypothetical protein